MSKIFASMLVASLLILTGCFSSGGSLLNPIGPEINNSESPAPFNVKSTLEQTETPYMPTAIATCSVTIKLDGIVPDDVVVPDTTVESKPDTKQDTPPQTKTTPTGTSSVTFRIILPAK